MTDPNSLADKSDADEYENSSAVAVTPTPANDPESLADKADTDAEETSK